MNIGMGEEARIIKYYDYSVSSVQIFVTESIFFIELFSKLTSRYAMYNQIKLEMACVQNKKKKTTKPYNRSIKLIQKITTSVLLWYQ